MLIAIPGVYDVPAAEYHGREICDAPSISSTGLRRILECPLKYWFNSPLNPDRPAEDSTPALNVGKAAHDLVLDGVGWPDRYHVLPEGFTAAGTKKWADAIADRDAAVLCGKTVLRHEDHASVVGMAAAIQKHPIHSVLGRGKAEATIVWKDAETGVWLRCRPDFLPENQRFIPDYKTTASAAPDDFIRSMVDYGYHQQAALYLDGLDAVFGQQDRSFYFIAQEKTPPFIVQPFELDDEALAWGRRLNRMAIRKFAKCLETNEWPGYAPDFATLSLPRWEAKRLQEAFQESI